MLHALRDSVAGRLTLLARRIASDFGWAQQLSNVGAPSMLGGLLWLHRRGFKPSSIVDVGACQGDWTQLARSVFPEAQILMIEPQQQHQNRLEALCRDRFAGVHYSMSLLGSEPRQAVEFTVLDNKSGGTGSSVLPENSDVPRHTELIPMTTLDALLAQISFAAPQLVKLDVQGYELEVLKGSPNCLQTADFVLLEASVRPYNHGAPLIAETLTWMEANDFRLFEVFDLSRDRADLLVQVDLLFIRRGHPWTVPARPI